MLIRALTVVSLFTACLAGISTNYKKPVNIVGINDQGAVLTNTLQQDQGQLALRQSTLKADINPSVHQYNAFWQAFESSPTPSAAVPVDCQDGYEMIPTSPAGLKVNGGLYNKYRCMSSGQTDLLQQFLQLDAEHDMQSGVVIWCPPASARDPGCLGMPQAASQSAPDNFTEAYKVFVQSSQGSSAQRASLLRTSIQEVDEKNSTAVAESALDASGCSCAPRLDAVDDYADFVTFLATEVSQREAYITHYIVFNEVASAEWFDLSGVTPGSIDVTQVVSAKDVTTWIGRYAQLMRVTHDALAAAKLSYPSLVYASLDRYWGVPPIFSQWHGTRAHIGSGTIAQGLWGVLGISMDWSLALHPYGEPDSREFNGENGIVNAYNFATLQDVSAQMLNSYKQAGGTQTNAPQLWTICSEQGWTNTQYNEEQRARILCEAHSISLANPRILYVAHNSFQNPGNDVYGLLPPSVNALLSNANTSVIYHAYMSMNDAVWGKSRTHYCCVSHNLGCAV